MTGGFHDHFSGVAGGYADFRPRYPAALFDHLATLPAARRLAWDCAAGSGQATIDLAGRFDRVIATDASAAQLAEAPPHPKVEYRVAPAEASGLPDRSVDLVTVAQALHWFDPERFAAEVRRVAAPGGILAVWTYGMHETATPAVDAVMQHFYRRVVGAWWPPERRHVENGYRDLPFPYPELPAPPFAMTADWTMSQLVGYAGTWSATSRYRAATGHDPLPELAAALAAAWGDPARTERVTWPLGLRVGRAGVTADPPRRP